VQITSAEEIWELVENFFRARKVFEEQYRRCENLVRGSAKRTRTVTENVRPCGQEVSQLLDLKALEKLRNDYLGRLREISHHIFKKGGTLQLFDKYVSDLYHEASILKEQQYAVEALDAGKQKTPREHREVLAGIHQFYSEKMRRLRDLFLKAQEQIELLMKTWSSEKALVRSLYLFADNAVADLYEGGVEGIYKVMYRLGALEGYLIAAESFAASYFSEQGLDALRKAKRALKGTKLLDSDAKKIRRRIREIEKTAKTVSV